MRKSELPALGKTRVIVVRIIVAEFVLISAVRIVLSADVTICISTSFAMCMCKLARNAVELATYLGSVLMGVSVEILHFQKVPTVAETSITFCETSASTIECFAIFVLGMSQNFAYIYITVRRGMFVAFISAKFAERFAMHVVVAPSLPNDTAIPA